MNREYSTPTHPSYKVPQNGPLQRKFSHAREEAEIQSCIDMDSQLKCEKAMKNDNIWCSGKFSHAEIKRKFSHA